MSGLEGKIVSFRLEKRAYDQLAERADRDQRRVEQVPSNEPLCVRGRVGGVSQYVRKLVYEHLELLLEGQRHGERTPETMNLTQRVTPTDRMKGRVRLRQDTKQQFARGEVLVSVKGSPPVRCRYDPNDSDGRTRSGLLCFRGPDKEVIARIADEERLRVHRDHSGVYHLAAIPE